jgi:signal transduction histidine kinase
MNTAQPNPPGGPSRPAAGDEQGWLGVVLGLHPIPCAVVELATGRVVLRNDAARQLPLDGAGPEGHFDGVAPGRAAAELAARAAGPHGADVTWRSAGREVHYRAFARPLPPTGHAAARALLTFLDVTPQKSAEAELRQAVEARDELFSIATHELKDPLFALQLSIQLLRHTTSRQGEVPPHVRQHLEVSERQVDRLTRLIDNLLDFSRIANRRVQLDVEALDLSELAREVVERFAQKARVAGTELTADAAGPVIGYFDRMKVEQVLVNLLSNALKYGEGQPVVVRTRADGETAVLEVEDRGPGVPVEDRERIFGRFERASGGHRKDSLGLGLYIVRSLVEAHGGEVALRSEPGKGATFTVSLPRKRMGRE